MDFILEMKDICDLVFSEELLNTLLCDYEEEMDTEDYTESQQNYAIAKELLPRRLSSGQQKLLCEIEDHYQKQVYYSMKFGIQRGIYAAFQHRFGQYPCDFQTLALSELQTDLPGEYDCLRTACNDRITLLQGELDPFSTEHLTSITAEWEERILGVLRHAFRMGYRMGLLLLKEIVPFPVIAGLNEKISGIEHEMGFDDGETMKLLWR